MPIHPSDAWRALAHILPTSALLKRSASRAALTASFRPIDTRRLVREADVAGVCSEDIPRRRGVTVLRFHAKIIGLVPGRHSADLDLRAARAFEERRFSGPIGSM